jgi:hypothetical protein
MDWSLGTTMVVATRPAAGAAWWESGKFGFLFVDVTFPL